MQNNYRMFFVARPFAATLCLCCGLDPRIETDERGTPVAWHEGEMIERKGQLCYDCAWSSAEYIVRQRGWTWER